MRVLHMLPTFDTGGLGSLGLELIRAWPRSDSHSVIASRFPTTKPDLRETFTRLVGDRVREVPRTLYHPMSFVDAMRDTATGLGPFDGAVIYNFFDHVWYTMGLRRAGFRGPVVCHVGTVLPLNEMIQKMLGSPFTAGVLFQPASRAVSDSVIAAGIDSSRMLPVVWNGVDLDVFPAKPVPAPEPIATGLGPDLTPVTFGFVGRMSPEAKDFEGLLEAYSKLDGIARERARLVLAGDGPHRRKYEALALHMGLIVTTDRDRLPPRGVAFLGSLERGSISTFLHSLDVFVMAALPIEGMSLALVEAIVSGLPIIATDVPANREVLDGCGAGTLTHGVEGLANALTWLTENAEARRRLAQASHAARDQFDVRRVAEAYRDVLQDDAPSHPAL